MQSPKVNIQLHENDIPLDLAFNDVVPALVLLLHKYSNYVSEVVNIEIKCNGVNFESKVLLSKAISTKLSWIDFQKEVNDELIKLIHPTSLNEIEHLEVNWITDNDEPGTEYSITISPSQKNN